MDHFILETRVFCKMHMDDFSTCSVPFPVINGLFLNDCEFLHLIKFHLLVSYFF